MLRALFHLTSSLVALAILWSVLHSSLTGLILLGIWYGIGIYASTSHIRWTNEQPNHPPVDNKVWIFYTWYSLSGLVLLVSTKAIEWKDTLQEVFPSIFRSE